ncbi:MAG: hypothetical protein V1929_12715 [bacterium]
MSSPSYPNQASQYAGNPVDRHNCEFTAASVATVITGVMLPHDCRLVGAELQYNTLGTSGYGNTVVAIQKNGTTVASLTTGRLMDPDCVIMSKAAGSAVAYIPNAAAVDVTAQAKQNIGYVAHFDGTATYTDGTEGCTDEIVNASGLDISSMDHTNDKIYLGFKRRPDAGGGVTCSFYVTMLTGSENANASVMSMKYWNGTAWASVATLVDGTIATGATFGASGLVTFDLPAAWAVKSVNSSADLYFVEIAVDAALDSDTKIAEIWDYDYVDVSSLPVGIATTGLLTIGFKRPFKALYVRVCLPNGTTNTLTGWYWNGTAWAAATITDNTASGGCGFAVAGTMTFTLPPAWKPRAMSGFAPNLGNMYWLQLRPVTAAMDSATTLSRIRIDACNATITDERFLIETTTTDNDWKGSFGSDGQPDMLSIAITTANTNATTCKLAMDFVRTDTQ